MYGIDKEDKEYIDNKIEKQKKFLKEFILDIGDKEINMLDNTYSANINPKKYFSEINNRVNSLHRYGRDNGLMAVFITITAPSSLHQKKLDGSLNINPNETAKFLSSMWHKFTSLQVIRKMKKDTGNGLIYFRVYEPHKSGVPHIHAMVYIPKRWVLLVKKAFYKHFKKVGIKQLQFKYTWYKEKGGAVAYMMKYITKTFKNAETDIMDDCAYWYIKYRIIRFCSSRTLCPLFIYRKSRYFFKDKVDDDYIHISKLYNNKVIDTLFDKTFIEYKYYDYEESEVNEVIIWGKKKFPELEQAKPKATFKLKYEKKKEYKSLKVVLDGVDYIYTKNQELVKPIIPVSKMTFSELYEYEKELLSNNDSFDFFMDKMNILAKEKSLRIFKF